jgi:DNA excision repair protein ERCC-3
MAIGGPIIVQTDGSVLLDVHHEDAEAARAFLVGVAELEKSPEHFHTYRITALSLWNAAAAGRRAEDALMQLEAFCRYEVPGTIARFVKDTMARYGLLELTRSDDCLVLSARDADVMSDISGHKTIAGLIRAHLSPTSVRVGLLARGTLKVALTKIGYPVRDLAGYAPGAPLKLALRNGLADGSPFALRRYQEAAAQAFYEQGQASGGSGVLTLPCGAGKTVIALRAMELLQASTLILVPGVTAARQWQRELLEKTSLGAEDVGEYSGERRDPRAVTVATYQILSYRPRGSEEFPHLSLLSNHNWGLIVYDEVHLLPAPVFRVTAEIQARRRLGLTATLIREDGREDEVFSLIGPKKYDVSWKELESQGWIATAICMEVRVQLDERERHEYAIAPPKDKPRIAATAARKDDIVATLVERHAEDKVLVIGQYLDQLQRIAVRLHAPIITGSTPYRERDRLYAAFREGEIRCLVVSKVANFSIDLPDASVAIQVSGAFGSRQEEAQRLGRIMRPKQEGTRAHFYAVVAAETSDQEFAHNRQRFLTEQGYEYVILDATEVTGAEVRS